MPIFAGIVARLMVD